MDRLRYPGLFLLFLLCQGLVLESLILYHGLAYGKLFLLFLLMLPLGTPLWVQYLTAFAMGFCVDLLHPPLGGHMFASVFIMGVRPYWARFISPSVSMDPQGLLDLPRQNLGWHLRYLGVLVLLYELTYNLLVNLSLAPQVWLEILLSWLYTLASCVLLLPLFYKR